MGNFPCLRVARKRMVVKMEQLKGFEKRFRNRIFKL